MEVQEASRAAQLSPCNNPGCAHSREYEEGGCSAWGPGPPALHFQSKASPLGNTVTQGSLAT